MQDIRIRKSGNGKHGLYKSQSSLSSKSRQAGSENGYPCPLIGVLALQGAFREHIVSLKKCGCRTVEIRSPEQLEQIDGLVIPGGESTTMVKLIEKYNFRGSLDVFFRAGKPIFGTCAGLILLAKHVKAFNLNLGYIDISVDRNAYGRQVDSFEQEVELDLGQPSGAVKNFNAVFIRAPVIKGTGENIQVLSRLDGNVILARQENILVCAFHPELTGDLRIHSYFLDMVKNSKSVVKFKKV